MPNTILIGAPIDEGQRRPGCVMGPTAYRVAGLAHLRDALVDLSVAVVVEAVAELRDALVVGAAGLGGAARATVLVTLDLARSALALALAGDSGVLRRAAAAGREAHARVGGTDAGPTVRAEVELVPSTRGKTSALTRRVVDGLTLEVGGAVGGVAARLADLRHATVFRSQIPGPGVHNTLVFGHCGPLARGTSAHEKT